MYSSATYRPSSFMNFLHCAPGGPAAADETGADAVGDIRREAAVGGRADGAPAQDPAYLRHSHVSHARSQRRDATATDSIYFVSVVQFLIIIGITMFHISGTRSRPSATSAARC